MLRRVSLGRSFIIIYTLAEQWTFIVRPGVVLVTTLYYQSAVQEKCTPLSFYNLVQPCFDPCPALIASRPTCAPFLSCDYCASAQITASRILRLLLLIKYPKKLR